MVGHLSSGAGIVIHRDNCSEVYRIPHTMHNLIKVEWSKKIKNEFRVELRIEVLNSRATLALVTKTLAVYEVGVEKVQIDARDSRHTAITFLIEVRHKNQLTKIIKQLRSIETVTRVSRGP